MAMSLNEVISSLWSNIKTYLGNNYLSKNGKAASATVADKATADASGNVITTTYATKTENSLKANNADVVHTSGDETIAGNKYFIYDICNKQPSITLAETPTSQLQSRYRFVDKNNATLGAIQYTSSSSGKRDILIHCEDAGSGIHGYHINTSNELYPWETNTYSLGTTAYRWKSAYINSMVSANITLSDANFLRCTYGSYGSFWRQDGKDLYLMLTNKNDQYGTWTTARPIQVNLSTGVCNINGNATSATKATKDASGNVITNTYITKTALSSGTNNGSASNGVGSLILGCVSRNDMASAESAAHSNSFLNISGSVIKLASLSMVSSSDVFAINRDSSTLPGTWRFLGYSKQPSNSLYTLGLFIRIA